MHKEEIMYKIKHFIYKIVCPIYLWSIGEKTLENYISKIEREYEHIHRPDKYPSFYCNCNYELARTVEGLDVCGGCEKISKETSRAFDYKV